MKDPVAERGNDELKPLAPRVGGLAGKRIGIYNNIKKASGPVSVVIEERLREKYPDAEFTRCEIPARDEPRLARIREWADEETDVCIVAIGDCGGCTRSVVRATNAIEETGTPAVGLVAGGFELSWETNSNDQGRYLRYQTIPIRSETTDIEEIREQITPEVFRGIEDELTRPLTEAEKGLEARSLLD